MLRSTLRVLRTARRRAALAVWLLIAGILGACGGGGSAEAPAAVTSKAVRPCLVQLFGDSTMAAAPVGETLQAALDERLGAGRAQVLVSARSGTQLSDLLSGSAGYEAFPASLRGDVVVANYGINDLRFGPGPEAYAAGLRELAARGVLLQTPLPILDADTGAYAAIARSIGGMSTIDAYTWMTAQPNWQSLIPDRVHPDAPTYRRLASEVIAPAVARAVSAACPA